MKQKSDQNINDKVDDDVVKNVEHNIADNIADKCNKYHSRSADETFQLGQRIGEQLTERAVFLLSGELGSGKTVFAKGIAAGLGIDPADVTSPSFTLVNQHYGRLPFYHIDLYRLDSGLSENLGLEEIFEENAVVVIEWAERLNLLPDRAFRVEFKYLSGDERSITIKEVAERVVSQGEDDE